MPGVHLLLGDGGRDRRAGMTTVMIQCGVVCPADFSRSS